MFHLNFKDMKKVFLSFTAVMASLSMLTAADVILPANVKPILPEGVSIEVSYLADNVMSRTMEEQPMIKCLGKLYFAATDAEHGTELWVSDGTTEGTKMIKDINAGATSSYPKWLTAVGNKYVYFQADNGENGAELWVTDGTEEGTRMVKDIFEGATGSEPQALTKYGVDKMLFFAKDDESDFNPVIDPTKPEKWLWITDGTEEGTMRIGDTPTDLETDGTRGCIVIINGKGIFAGYDRVNNQTIWATDGTAAGTAPLMNINPRPDTTGVFETKSAHINHLVAVDGRVAAFRARTVKEITGDTIDWGLEMWITDGTTAGTKQIGFPINKIEKEGELSSSDFRQTYPFGDHLYFRANNGNGAVNGAEPWVWYIDEPIKEGTNPRLIQDLGQWKHKLTYNSHPSCFYEYKQHLFVSANFTYFVPEIDPQTGDTTEKMWDSGYDAICRGNIADIRAGSDSSIVGEYLWTGFEIFPDHTKEITPRTHKFQTANDTCFFVCQDAAANFELWKIDSKVAGSGEFNKPVKVMDLPDDGQICYTTQMKQQLYFVSATQKQLYVYQMPNLIVPVDKEDLEPEVGLLPVYNQMANPVQKQFIPGVGVVVLRDGQYFNMLGTNLK